MKVKPKDVLALVIIVACFIFMWNGKDGIIVTIMLTVVVHEFGDIYQRFNNGK